MEHVESNKLLPSRQSAYRRHHSTEAAVVSLMNDIILAIDAGEVSALVLLDLSAAFDTVDHATLLDVLHHRFAMTGVPLTWFKSYLTNRSQAYSVGGIQSKKISVDCSVPQGSVLGPLEFISYTEDVVELFKRHSLIHHLFADDKQLLAPTKVSDTDITRLRLSQCITDVRLQLNASKTELIWFGSHAKLGKLSNVDLTLSVDNDVIKPVALVRDLGVFHDSELTMKQHVSHTPSSCFFHLRRLRQIRRVVGPDVTKKLVTSFILSRLDYCNAALAGLPHKTIRPLQRVQNAAARLISGTGHQEQITPVLKQLHWLPVKLSITYKLCLMMHLVHTKQSPEYMQEIVTLTADSASRPGLRSGDSLSFNKPRTRTKLGERAFAFSGPAAWNCLPNNLQCINNTACFKRHLKTHLFTLF